MKTIAYILLMLAGVAEAKAQQRPLTPYNKWVQPPQAYTFKSDTGLNQLHRGKLDSLKDRMVITNKTIMGNVDHMAVVKLTNTDPHMAIVQTDRTGYTMPIAGMNLPKVYTMTKPGDIAIKQLP